MSEVSPEMRFVVSPKRRDQLFGALGRRGTMLIDKTWRSLWSLCETAPAGDFVECGVWHGGASILMSLYGRRQWMFDTWAGMPQTAGLVYGYKEKGEGGWPGAHAGKLSVCTQNFETSGAERDGLFFMRGPFKDTLSLYSGEIALLRLDADLYSSTRECLEALYEKVVPGGYVIIDDYIFPACKLAVDEFREGIASPLMRHDGTVLDMEDKDPHSRWGVWWQK